MPETKTTPAIKVSLSIAIPFAPGKPDDYAKADAAVQKLLDHVEAAGFIVQSEKTAIGNVRAPEKPSTAQAKVGATQAT